jgi:hypothetical protein
MIHKEYERHEEIENELSRPLCFLWILNICG